LIILRLYNFAYEADDKLKRRHREESAIAGRSALITFQIDKIRGLPYPPAIGGDSQ